ncbi:MAG: COX15/CtaA family protein [Actinomycetota bacterium]
MAWVMQGLIVLSGAAVRLTEAGLGCEDWPTCNEGELLPEWQIHGLIEFGNRVISLAVTVSAVLVVVAARRLNPARPEPVRFAWMLVAGTVAQIVLGGLTVLLDLHPAVVGIHFLFSMALLWAAQSLWLLAGEPGDHDWFRYSTEPTSVRTVGPVDQRTATLARLQMGMAAAVLLIGTLVTGTGPHSGDSRAERLPFDLTQITRVHSTAVWLLLLILVVFAVHLARDADRTEPQIASGFVALRWLLVAVVAQGGLGYLQFSLGVPAALVEAHIFGALVVWSFSILTHRRIIGFQVTPVAATITV